MSVGSWLSVAEALKRAGGAFPERALLDRLGIGLAVARAGYAIVKDGGGRREERDWLVPVEFWTAVEEALHYEFGSLGRCGFTAGRMAARWGSGRNIRQAEICDMVFCWDKANMPGPALPQQTAAERVSMDKACAEWLMRGFASADTIHVKKDQWRFVAREKFDGLSNDGFDFAWGQATHGYPERSNKGRSKLTHAEQMEVARGVR